MRSRPSFRTHTLRLLIPLVLAVLAGWGEGHAQDSAATRASAPALQPPADPSQSRADSLFARGEAYRARQRFDSARLSYEAAIHANPAVASADTSLARLKTLPRTALDRDPFAAVRTLARAGFDEEARAELKKALAANPDHPVPGDLRHLTGGEIGWWRDLRRWSVQTGRQALEIAVVLVALWLIGWWAFLYLFGKPLLQIADFQGTPGAEEDKKGELDGTELSALVETYLKQLASSAPLTRGPVQGPSEPAKVPVDLQGLIPGGAAWLSVAVSVMAWLHPKRVVRIHGLLLPPGPQGRGVMLRLTQGDGVVDSITLWEHHLVSARAVARLATRVSPWQLLAQSAAAWALFRAGDVQPRLRTTQPFRVLGTTQWRSYALFSAGVRLQQYGFGADAEKAYWEALREDSGNLGARVNLGTVLIERERARQAIRQLKLVSEQAEKANEVAVWYLARYREAVAWHALGEAEPANHIAHRTQARTVAEQLLADLEARRKPGAGMTPSLRRTLDELQPTVKVLHAGLRASLGTPANVLAGELGDQFDDLPVAHTQYNLASIYMILAQRAGTRPDQQDKWLEQALERLAFVLRLEPQRASALAKNADFALLRNHPRLGEKLDEVLKEYDELVNSGLSLERVAAIGTYARKLADAKIEDAAALQARCGTAAGKLGIAVALGVTVQTVERWAQIAGLLTLPKMEPAAVNALCRAGIDSRAALVRCSPGELTARLEHLATAAGETDRHEFFEVAAWIASARAN